MPKPTPAPFQEITCHHVAFTVKNIDEALRFYRGVFGFPELERPSEGVKSNRGAWFQVGAMQLHLQWREASTPKTDQHFAVEVENLDALAARARDFGGRIETAGLLAGFTKRAFLYDLDGNRIELLQK